MTLSLEHAEEILAERANGHIDGYSASKGGRVWLEGEFDLAEIEAIAVKIRHVAGEHAQGAEELLKVWHELDKDSQV